jgi:hypothetical protein
MIGSLDVLAQLQFDVLRGERHMLEMVFDQFSLIPDGLRVGAARLQVIAQRRHDERLDFSRRHAADQSGCLRVLLQHGLGDIVAIAGASFVGVARAHAVAAIIEEATAQERGPTAQPAAPGHRLRRKPRLHGIEQGPIEDRRVVAPMDFATVDHLADVERFFSR